MMKVTTHIVIAAFATTAASLAVGLSGCTPATSRTSPRELRGGVLTSMGFSLTDDGDPSTPAGDLSASFDSPVIGAEEDLLDAGTAHAVFDDGERDLSSATVIDAYPDADVVYAVLFDENEPWRYVIVAAHGADLVAGADVALDGQDAAALVVDENTGSGFLSSSGTLHVDTAELTSGGRLSGSLDAGLVEVGLDSWPEALFPFTVDGQPSERAAADGAGTFAAVTSVDGSSPPGTADVSVSVDGYGTFTGGAAYAMPADDSDTVIVIEDGAGGRGALAIFVDNSALAAGTVSLGGYVAGASLLEEDGTQIAFVDGTLTLDAVDTSEGGVISGSFSVTGDAYVLPPDAYGDPGDPGNPDGEDCTGIDTLASTFTPAQAYLQTATPDDQFPAGYDRALTLTDDGAGMFGVLIPTGVDLHAGDAYAFSTVDFEGRPFPAAGLAIATCSQWIDVESGTLTAVLDDASGTVSGSLSYVVDGASRELGFEVPLVP